MKLTDMAIVFACILMCIVTKWNIKNEVLVDKEFHENMLNACIDDLAIEALRFGVCTSIDENADMNADTNNNVIDDINAESYIKLDKERILSFFTKYVSLFDYEFFGNKMNIMDRSFLVLTCNEGFYISDGLKWSKMYKYVDDNHANMVSQIQTVINESIGIEVLFSTNQGEKFKNTVSKNSLIIIYCGLEQNIDKENYCIRIVSGAKINVNQEIIKPNEAETIDDMAAGINIE